jgi:hypothetical protein
MTMRRALIGGGSDSITTPVLHTVICLPTVSSAADAALPLSRWVGVEGLTVKYADVTG